MKTVTLFFFILFALTLTANAQITKGNWMVGGSASFRYSKTENKNNSSDHSGVYAISLEPNVGYFIKNRLAFGLGVDYINAFGEDKESKFKFDNADLGIMPYVRYYFLNEDKNYNIFLEPSYYRFMSDFLGNSSGFAVKSGFVVFLNKSVAFETILKYYKYFNDNTNNTNIYFGFGIQVHLERI